MSDSRFIDVVGFEDLMRALGERPPARIEVEGTQNFIVPDAVETFEADDDLIFGWDSAVADQDMKDIIEKFSLQYNLQEEDDTES